MHANISTRTSFCVSFSHLINLESEIPVCPSLVINSCVLFSRVKMSVRGILACSYPTTGASADGLQFSAKREEIIRTSWTSQAPVWDEGVEFIIRNCCLQKMTELSLDSQQMPLKVKSTGEASSFPCCVVVSCQTVLIILYYWKNTPMAAVTILYIGINSPVCVFYKSQSSVI